jgi:hypothetical protein
MGWTDGFRFPAEKIFFLVRPDLIWGPPTLLLKGYCGLITRQESGRGVKLTIHLHLVSRLRMMELYLHSSIGPNGVVLNYLNKVTTLSFPYYCVKRITSGYELNTSTKRRNIMLNSKSSIFCAARPCRLVGVCLRFGGTWCFKTSASKNWAGSKQSIAYLLTSDQDHLIALPH